jgi:hypothetical protein
MKIIGFNITKLGFERKDSVSTEIKIHNNLEITDLDVEEISLSNSPVIKIKFAYKISYVPEVAEISIEGLVLVLDEENESKKILKEWKEKKTVSHDFKISILNFVLGKCNVKALQIEDELGLPLHVPFPKIMPAEKARPENKAKYTG